MTLLQPIEARAHHCGQISRQLRAEHRDILDQMHVPTHRELRDAFDASVIRRAWLLNGSLCALAGITGTSASSHGVIWLALTDEATKHPVQVARGAMRFIEEVMRVKRTLSTTLLADDRHGMLLLYFLGFHVEHKMMHNGAQVILMSYEKRKAAA